MLNNKSLLITGGTGSFGNEFIKTIISKYKKIRKIIVFSRDEYKQHQMQQKFPTSKYSFMRYFLGDIRDKERLILALKDVDIVIHAAALKQVPAAEYNPFEFVKTNIIGAQNIIEASLNSNVKKVLALSTDKAASPINLYGATKLCSDKLFSSANNMKGKKNISFSVVRYGNVLGSRGSVLNIFLDLKKKKISKMPITNTSMTRFNITLPQSVDIVLNSLKIMQGGEIFVPKTKSYKILELAKAVEKNLIINEVGIRPGEKLHEELISRNDSYYTYDIGSYYVILNPISTEQGKTIKYYKKNFKLVDKDFSYTSDKNEFLSIEEIKSILKKLKFSS